MPCIIVAMQKKPEDSSEWEIRFGGFQTDGASHGAARKLADLNEKAFLEAFPDFDHCSGCDDSCGELVCSYRKSRSKDVPAPPISLIQRSKDVPAPPISLIQRIMEHLKCNKSVSTSASVCGGRAIYTWTLL